MPAKIDTSYKFNGQSLIGHRFGRLVVESYVGTKHYKVNGHRVVNAYWTCRCVCGGKTIVGSGSLRRGHSTSCGCWNTERLTKHGLSTRSAVHPVYNSWAGMIKRCNYKHSIGWKYYGGRGITVCDKWRDFVSFKNDMLPTWSPGMTLDRINNDGNYEPGNVRWATRQQQANNTSANHRIEFRGVIKTITEWSQFIGGTDGLVTTRLKSGWSVEEALTTKSQRPKKSDSRHI